MDNLRAIVRNLGTGFRYEELNELATNLTLEQENYLELMENPFLAANGVRSVITSEAEFEEVTTMLDILYELQGRAKIQRLA